MYPRKTLALVMTALIGFGAACSTEADASQSTATTAAAATAATDAATSDTATAADTTATDPATDTADATAATTDSGSTDRGGPGGGVSVSSVATEADLVALIQEAYGDASLGLHRGHQPVESTLIEVLGITHDEMHVRMETQGQNLAAIATDLGIDPQTLIDALVDSWSPAIDNLVADGTITEEQGEAYHSALEEAFTYRVTWNGSDATPTFSGI